MTVLLTAEQFNKSMIFRFGLKPILFIQLFFIHELKARGNEER
jgi:hypothetical protein